MGHVGQKLGQILENSFTNITCCCCVFIFLSKTHYLSQKFAILFTMLIYLVYLTYCKICDRLQGYKDTDLAYLTGKKYW